MDQNEIAERLQELRDRIRAELDDAEPPRLAAGLADPRPLELDEFEAPAPPDQPQLHTTPHLQTANDLAVITGPIEVRSRAPLLGPVLTLLRKLARPFVQPFLDPYLVRQEKFNAEVVRHLNVQGGLLEERLTAIYRALEESMSEPRLLESRLDTALAEYDEALRQRHVVLFDALEEELWALRGRVDETWSGVGRQLHEFDVRFVDRAQAVDARFDEKDAAVTELAGRIDRLGDLPGKAEMFETRTRLAEVLEQLERDGAGTTGGGGADAAAGPFDGPLWRELRAWMSDQDYRAHQAAFRGDPEEIRRRLREHVRRFEGVPGPVADLGCGRGEFLQLLSEAGLDGVGVEINAADVEQCREDGLQAEQGDLFDWLEDREPDSLGGIFLAQVIEHLPPPQWRTLVRLAATRLAPGGRLVIETINPESLFALARAYVIDPTHVRPVHPSLLSLLANRAGFGAVEVEYQAPVPASFRPEPIDEDLAAGDQRLHRVVEEINQRLRRIDELCCRPQEYALIAERPAS